MKKEIQYFLFWGINKGVEDLIYVETLKGGWTPKQGVNIMQYVELKDFTVPKFNSAIKLSLDRSWGTNDINKFSKPSISFCYSFQYENFRKKEDIDLHPNGKIVEYNDSSFRYFHGHTEKELKEIKNMKEIHIIYQPQLIRSKLTLKETKKGMVYQNSIGISFSLEEVSKLRAESIIR